MMRACAILLLAATASAAADDRGLDVSIAVFDPGVPDDRSVHRDLGVFPRIREIESLLLPFALRDTLATTGEWGAVRVVPEADFAAELLVAGRIVVSDGESLGIEIRAMDASGRSWVERTFRGNVPESQALYDEIAAALSLARTQFAAPDLERIRELSMLRYAAQLAPSAFGDYLRIAADGSFVIERLPADDDPMLARIRRLRETEYVITDAVDAKFHDLYGEIRGVYDLWRDYRRKTLQYEATNAERAISTASSAPRGSFEDLLNRYENYKWDRVTAQEVDRLAVAFDTEVAPKVDAMEARVDELRGWVSERYATWNRLLEALFEAETEAERNIEGQPELPTNLVEP